MDPILEIQVHLNLNLSILHPKLRKYNWFRIINAFGMVEPGLDHQYSSLNGLINSNPFILKPILLSLKYQMKI